MRSPLKTFIALRLIRLEIDRSQRGHLNLIHLETGFKADIYASVRDELHHWGLKNSKPLDVEGEKFWLAPVEYVIYLFPRS